MQAKESIKSRKESSGKAGSARNGTGGAGLSYKFQRLREKIRAAIDSGELSGKLPGERTLAKRFHANAKTLSKALTDLAAEGVLDRSIGRGTFVKGSQPPMPAQGRWLVLCDERDADGLLVRILRESNPELQAVSADVTMRPSFLNHFCAVIDMASNTPEWFLRDMVVRGMPLIAVNREPNTYSMHSVLLDVALGTSRLGRDLLLAGHRRLVAIEPRGSSTVAFTLRHAIARYAPDATVDACAPDEARSAVEAGATAFICGSCAAADQVKRQLEQLDVNVPGRVSLAGVGCIGDCAPCSGYYCSARQVADAVVGLLRDASTGRPATLWLAGSWHDLGTTGPVAPLHIGDETGVASGRVLI